MSLGVTFPHPIKTRQIPVADRWLVLKFGGTSVCGKPQWERIASLAQRRLEKGYRVVLVCSAVSGVTDSLQHLADHAGASNEDELDETLNRHLQLAEALQVDASDLVQETDSVIRQSLKEIVGAADQQAHDRALATLLAVGEWLSTRIGERYLARHMPVQWVDSRDALKALPEPANGGRVWLSARCASGVDEALTARWASKPSLLIAQGFVAMHPEGGTVLLGRGGSDTSAALLASRLAAERIEIWTDVPGLFSADPRAIPGARLLQSLSYDEALEMAASGAKVVHPRCIRAAADVDIPVMIRDLGQAGFSGTAIQANDEPSTAVVEGIRAVCLFADQRCRYLG
jgi:diaminopimelate decarboxylase/aspartate kinase